MTWLRFLLLLWFPRRRWWRTPIWILSNRNGFMQSVHDKRCCPISPTPSSPELYTVCSVRPHSHPHPDEGAAGKAINTFSVSDKQLHFQRAISQLFVIIDAFILDFIFDIHIISPPQAVFSANVFNLRPSAADCPLHSVSFLGLLLGLSIGLFLDCALEGR